MKMEIWIINGVEYTSVSQMAKIIKVTPPTIYRWIYMGCPACKSEVNTYLIPMRAALEWVEDYRGKSW